MPSPMNTPTLAPPQLATKTSSKSSLFGLAIASARGFIPAAIAGWPIIIPAPLLR